MRAHNYERQWSAFVMSHFLIFCDILSFRNLNFAKKNSSLLVRRVIEDISHFLARFFGSPFIALTPLLGGGFANIFLLSALFGEDFQFWRAYFSDGLKPPTSFKFGWFLNVGPEKVSRGPKFCPRLERREFTKG